jgi:hypothetical protein
MTFESIGSIRKRFSGQSSCRGRKCEYDITVSSLRGAVVRRKGSFKSAKALASSVPDSVGKYITFSLIKEC